MTDTRWWWWWWQRRRPTRCNYLDLFIPNQLYMFREMYSPIIRSTWLYLQLLVCPPMLLPAGVMDELSSMTPPGSNISGHTRRCKYSQVLLMMCEYIAPKHVELIRNNQINLNSCVLLVVNYSYNNRSRCSACCFILPLETLTPPPTGDPNGGVPYLRNVLSPGEDPHTFICFWKETIHEK